MTFLAAMEVSTSFLSMALSYTLAYKVGGAFSKTSFEIMILVIRCVIISEKGNGQWIGQ